MGKKFLKVDNLPPSPPKKNSVWFSGDFGYVFFLLNYFAACKIRKRKNLSFKKCIYEVFFFYGK